MEITGGSVGHRVWCLAQELVSWPARPGAGTARPAGPGHGGAHGTNAFGLLETNFLLVCGSYWLGLIRNVSSAISLNELFWWCMFYI